MAIKTRPVKNFEVKVLLMEYKLAVKDWVRNRDDLYKNNMGDCWRRYCDAMFSFCNDLNNGSHESFKVKVRRKYAGMFDTFLNNSLYISGFVICHSKNNVIYKIKRKSD